MADQTTATPLAPSGGIDQEALAKAIGTSVQIAVADALKPLADQLGKLQPAAAQATATPAAAAAAGLTADDVKKIVEGALGTHTQATKVNAARDRFMTEKMKDLPEIYRAQMPATDDPAQLAAAEQKIRTQFQADYKLAGGTATNVGGAAGGGTSPAQTVDLSKLTPQQLIEQGLKTAKVQGPGALPASSGAAAAAGAEAAAAK